MTAQRAFVAELSGLDIESGMVVVRAALPRHEFDAFGKGIGMPWSAGDGDRWAIRSVALVWCETPQHPLREGDVLAATLTERLIELLTAEASEGGLTLSPALLECLGRLTAILGRRIYGERPAPPPEAHDGL
jgi:hypothetical protein